jgi:hypothetical protein
MACQGGARTGLPAIVTPSGSHVHNLIASNFNSSVYYQIQPLLLLGRHHILPFLG